MSSGEGSRGGPSSIVAENLDYVDILRYEIRHFVRHWVFRIRFSLRHIVAILLRLS